MKLLVGTRNPDKLAEIRSVFETPGEAIELVDLTSYPDLPPVVEDGDTFKSNAMKKAVTVAVQAGLWTLSDDSGLEVTALHDEPGVHSARYAGPDQNSVANNMKLLAALEGVNDRRARFRCVIALSSSTGSARVVEGSCEGHIATEVRGASGFGYDPLFIPDGHELTFSELGSEIKNQISHRAKALALARLAWHEILFVGARDWPPSTR